MLPLTDIFHFDPDTPHHLYIPDHVLIQTPDTHYGAELWTRYTQSHYQNGGFLSLDGKTLIDLKIFVRHPEDGAFYPYRNETALKTFFDERIQEGKANAIHYYPGRSVCQIVTGVDFGPAFFQGTC